MSLIIRAIRSPSKTLQYMKDKSRDLQMNSLWQSQDYVLNNVKSSDISLVDRFPNCPEVEHQVGRFLNMKSIASEIEENAVSGDIIEFGTWQGLGILLLSSAFESSTHPRKFIGIDSFEGLPESSTVWVAGAFNDTSYDFAQKNISSRIHPNHHFSLIQGWFSDNSVSEKLKHQVVDISLVHFDADLGSSTRDALNIVEGYLYEIRHPVYFLFDDWGCHPDEVPDAFYEWLADVQNNLQITAEKLSSTRYSRYYKLTVIN